MLRGDHPPLPLEVLVDGVVEVHGREEGLVPPHPTVVLLRANVLVLSEQLRIVLFYAA